MTEIVSAWHLERSAVSCKGQTKMSEWRPRISGIADSYGLALPENVLRQVYAGNFARLVGVNPRLLDREQVIAVCREQSARIAALTGRPLAETEAARVVQRLEEDI